MSPGAVACGREVALMSLLTSATDCISPSAMLL